MKCVRCSAEIPSQSQFLPEMWFSHSQRFNNSGQYEYCSGGCFNSCQHTSVKNRCRCTSAHCRRSLPHRSTRGNAIAPEIVNFLTSPSNVTQEKPGRASSLTPVLKPHRGPTRPGEPHAEAGLAPAAA